MTRLYWLRPQDWRRTQVLAAMSDPKRDYSSLFKVLNPELFMKPNARVGILGTAVAVGVCGWLYYEKRRIEADRKARDNRAPRLERSFSE